MLNARIKLRHLQAFLEVARHRSFARAADTLAISQPGMSKTIRELEDILGTPLFERTPWGISLTQPGLTLLRHAGPAIRALEEGMVALGDEHQGVLLRVGALSTVETQLLPDAICRWYGEDRGTGEAGIKVISEPSAFLLSRLRRGELDLVVGRMTEAREIQDLSFEHLYYEALILVVRVGHPLAGSKTLSPDQLSAFPWVLPSAHTTLRQQVDSFLVRHSLVLPPAQLETLSLPISRGYTLESDAIWVAPEEAVAEDREAGRLCRLALDLESRGGSVGLCTNTSMQPSLALEAFCEILREVTARRQMGQIT